MNINVALQSIMIILLFLLFSQIHAEKKRAELEGKIFTALLAIAFEISRLNSENKNRSEDDE